MRMKGKQYGSCFDKLGKHRSWLLGQCLESHQDFFRCPLNHCGGTQVVGATFLPSILSQTLETMLPSLPHLNQSGSYPEIYYERASVFDEGSEILKAQKTKMLNGNMEKNSQNCLLEVIANNQCAKDFVVKTPTSFLHLRNVCVNKTVCSH